MAAVAAAELLSFRRRPMSRARLGQGSSKTTSDLCASLFIPPAIPKKLGIRRSVFIAIYFPTPIGLRVTSGKSQLLNFCAIGQHGPDLQRSRSGSTETQCDDRPATTRESHCGRRRASTAPTACWRCPSGRCQRRPALRGHTSEPRQTPGTAHWATSSATRHSPDPSCAAGWCRRLPWSRSGAGRCAR